MTEQDLRDLLIAIEGVWELKRALGLDRLGFGFEDGVFGKLERLEEVISRHTEWMDADERVSILDSELTIDEKVRRLMQ